MAVLRAEHKEYTKCMVSLMFLPNDIALIH